MPIGNERGVGGEPGAPLHRYITSPKDAALEDARAAGLLQVLEGRYSVLKYDREVAPERLYEVVTLPPNLFLTGGVNKLWSLIAGVSSTHLDATNARLCVGDNSTAPTAADVNLAATTNKLRKVVQGPPVISGNQITFSAQFGTSEANWAWLEVGVANDADPGQLISRSAIASPGLGTKVNTAVWVLNWTLSIS